MFWGLMLPGMAYSCPELGQLFCLLGPIPVHIHVILHNSFHSHFMDEDIDAQRGDQFAQDGWLMCGRTGTCV